MGTAIARLRHLLRPRNTATEGRQKAVARDQKNGAKCRTEARPDDCYIRRVNCAGPMQDPTWP